MVIKSRHKRAVFSGCLIKELGASKGNLADANVIAWPNTIRNLKQKYPEAQILIPGHGKSGGTEFFDCTIKLFSIRKFANWYCRIVTFIIRFWVAI
jgi:hypothetical protein